MNRPSFFVALDVPTEREAIALAASLRPVVARFKVGLELFTAAGPPVVRSLVEAGDEVFLDLKLHDIPRTVEGAVRSIAGLGVTWTTLHAAGGQAMLEAAAGAAALSGSEGVRLLAVTVLTSLDREDLAATGVEGEVVEQVGRLAGLALDAGIEGLVCSPQDVSRVRVSVGEGPTLVCPGVRPEGGSAGDQKRVGTPRQALEDGADLLVVGRSITAAPDPVEAAGRIIRDLRR